jgi:hypothetical protein
LLLFFSPIRRELRGVLSRFASSTSATVLSKVSGDLAYDDFMRELLIINSSSELRNYGLSFSIILCRCVLFSIEFLCTSVERA